MVIRDRLVHYNTLSGPKGRLATLFRFQQKPNSEFPRIYLPADSLLNHKSRLVRSARMWLTDLLSSADLREVELALVCHDVMEIVDGDISRLSADDEGELSIISEYLLPDDVIRYQDFLVAQKFLEKGDSEIPETPHSVIARFLDTVDGNYFAFALLEHYASKVEDDPNLQLMLDRSYAYVNKMRLKYRQKVDELAGLYDLDLKGILAYLQEIEAEKLDKFSQVIESHGYRTSAFV